MSHFGLGALADLTRRSARGWVDDAAPTMGAALAFYTVLSLAPLLLVAIGVAGFVVGRDEAHARLIEQLALLLGDKAAIGIEGILDAAGSREEGFWPTVVGLATMFIGATTVFAELRTDLNRIWRTNDKAHGSAVEFLLARVFSFLLVMSIGALLIFSMVASTFLAAVGSWWFGKSQLALQAIEFTTSFVVITLLFAMIYKILPSRRIAWGDVWVGAAVTSVLFWVGKVLIALYISKTAVDSSFGAAGTLVIVILWVYYSSQVFFLGAEFTKEYALRHGSKRNQVLQPPSELAQLNADYETLAQKRDAGINVTRDNWIQPPLAPPSGRAPREA
jgi:membrane protein